MGATIRSKQKQKYQHKKKKVFFNYILFLPVLVFANEDHIIQSEPVFTLKFIKAYFGPCVSGTAVASSPNIQIFECFSKIPLKLRVSPVPTQLEVFGKKALPAIQKFRRAEKYFEALPIILWSWKNCTPWIYVGGFFLTNTSRRLLQTVSSDVKKESF